MTVVTNPPTISDLAAALAAATPRLDALDRRIVLATYRLLARGESVFDGQVAEAVGAPVDQVAQRLRLWPGVYRDDDDAIVGFWGLARDPLHPQYRLEIGPETVVAYAWCAWDTLFLPRLLGETVRVTATDGLSGEEISLIVTPQRVLRCHPPETVVTFLVPDGPFDADVVAGFCHKVLFFENGFNATEWMAGRPDELFALSVDDAFEVGRQVTGAIYGDGLDS